MGEINIRLFGKIKKNKLHFSFKIQRLLIYIYLLIKILLSTITYIIFFMNINSSFNFLNFKFYVLKISNI